MHDRVPIWTLQHLVHCLGASIQTAVKEWSAAARLLCVALIGRRL